MGEFKASWQVSGGNLGGGGAKVQFRMPHPACLACSGDNGSTLPFPSRRSEGRNGSLPACCSTALKTHSGSYKMTRKPHSLYQRRLVQQNTPGPNLSSGGDWARIWWRVRQVLGKGSVTVSAASCSWMSQGLDFSWKWRTLLVMDAIPWLSRLYVLSPGEGGMFPFLTQHDSHLHDKDSPVSTSSLILLLESQTVISNSFLDISMWRSYWWLKLNLPQTKFRLLTPTSALFLSSFGWWNQFTKSSSVSVTCRMKPRLLAQNLRIFGSHNHLPSQPHSRRAAQDSERVWFSVKCQAQAMCDLWAPLAHPAITTSSPAVPSPPTTHHLLCEPRFLPLFSPSGSLPTSSRKPDLIKWDGGDNVSFPKAPKSNSLRLSDISD